MCDSIDARKYVRQAALRVNWRFYELLSKAENMPLILLENYLIDPKTAKILPDAVCKRLFVLPIHRVSDKLTVVAHRPASAALIDELQELTGLKVKAALAPRFHILRILCDTYC